MTDPYQNRDPDQFLAALRLKPQTLPDLPMIPAISPLRGR